MPASFCRAASASAMKPMNAVSRSSVSRSAISRAGVSQASTVPACISEMRSQRRASFMKWVETKIVTPWRRERSMSNSQNSSRATGSTPEVGSSSRSMSGSCNTATARESRCFSPSGRSSEGVSRCERRPKRSTSSTIRASARSRGKSKILAWRSRFCRTESSP